MDSTEFNIEPLDDELVRRITRQKSGVVRISPPGVIHLRQLVDVLPEIRDMEVRDDDLWVVTYPKSGTTWTQEMAWLLANNCDFEKAKGTVLSDRFAFLEESGIRPGSGRSLTDIAALPSPRFIKTHLPYQLLPKQLWTKKAKVIYAYRNPKDVIISYFHYVKTAWEHDITLDGLVEVFLQDKALYAPYWNHVLSFWNARKQPNILFNTFEDMVADLKGVIRNTGEFLGVRISPDQVDRLTEHLSFDNMKNNKSINLGAWSADESPLRSGKTGQWDGALSKLAIDQLDQWAKKNLQGTAFPHY